MRKRQSGATDGTASRHSDDRYDVVEMDRRDLKSAPYNPRVLTPEARRRLTKGIKKFGLLAPLTWNRRTGHIVGGHQRIAVLDAVKGTDAYTTRVAAVDLDETAEKEANILLNNQEAAGEFDLAGLGELLKTPGLDMDATGFDVATVYRLFGESPAGASMAQIDALGAKVREAQERFVATGKKFHRDGQLDYYLVVVFADWDQRKAFLDALGLDDNRYQDGRTLQQLLAVGQHVESESAATGPKI